MKIVPPDPPGDVTVNGVSGFCGLFQRLRRAVASANRKRPNSQYHEKLASRLQRALAKGEIVGLSDPCGLIQFPKTPASPPIQAMKRSGISSSSLAGWFCAH